MTQQYSKLLFEASKKFKGTKFEGEVEKASQAYIAQNYGMMESILKALPTEQSLLATLLEQLKGKSVEKGIKKALDESKASLLEQGIAVSSLITHTLIEMRKNPEYKILLPNLYTRLGDFVNV